MVVVAGKRAKRTVKYYKFSVGDSVQNLTLRRTPHCALRITSALPCTTSLTSTCLGVFTTALHRTTPSHYTTLHYTTLHWMYLPGPPLRSQSVSRHEGQWVVRGVQIRSTAFRKYGEYFVTIQGVGQRQRQLRMRARR